MDERKLVSIQKVEELTPIEGADKIECAKVLGWKVVVGKDEFKVGDLCAYHEIDSLLPLIPQYEFLAKGNKPKTMIVNGKEIQGYRLKTIRLKKQISQGLALPLTAFNICGDIGEDITNLIGVHKYEMPIPVHMSGEIKGSFPGFLPRTDEERIQNIPEALNEHKDSVFYITEKLDGTSCTFYKYEGHFGVCSHNLKLKENENNLYWRIAKQYNLANILPEGFAIQGEIVGEGIQKNRLKLKGQDIYIFYIFDIKRHQYLHFLQTKDYISTLGLKQVPCVNEKFVLHNNMEELLSLADGKSQLNLAELREGIVFVLRAAKSPIPEGIKISFKIINNEYLLKHGE